MPPSSATIAGGPGRKKAARAIIRNSLGKASRASTPRISTASPQRGPSAAADPTATPRSEGQQHRDHPHRERHAGAEEDAGEEVAAEPVAAEPVDPAVGDAAGGEVQHLGGGQRLDGAEARDLYP